MFFLAPFIKIPKTSQPEMSGISPINVRDPRSQRCPVLNLFHCELQSYLVRSLGQIYMLVWEELSNSSSDSTVEVFLLIIRICMSCPALHQGQPHACPVFQAYGFSFHPQIPLELPLFMQGSDFGIYRRHQPWCKVPGIYCYHAEFLSILVDCAGFGLRNPQKHPCLAWTHRKV